MPGGCGDLNCYMCMVMPGKFPQPCNWQEREDAKKATRDGDPGLAAERKRGNLAFRKRTSKSPTDKERQDSCVDFWCGLV